MLGLDEKVSLRYLLTKMPGWTQRNSNEFSRKNWNTTSSDHSGSYHGNISRKCRGSTEGNFGLATKV
ncbi:hypothetical protein OS493_029577 [Desmophyllum pertusum]|uniref:Uncharacterized protein n=1 Tax=Desmophyllum pertusum TaxID=174260 RepID=A0A9X0D7J3_9CNID|nr:hypothetical protein OS493_029577 [Desmophyllum pertusum]